MVRLCSGPEAQQLGVHVPENTRRVQAVSQKRFQAVSLWFQQSGVHVEEHTRVERSVHELRSAQRPCAPIGAAAGGVHRIHRAERLWRETDSHAQPSDYSWSRGDVAVGRVDE